MANNWYQPHFVSSHAAVCAELKQQKSDSTEACTTPVSNLLFCIPSKSTCDEKIAEGNGEFNAAVDPICFNWTKEPGYSANVAGRTLYNRKTGQCSCFTQQGQKAAHELFPDLETGYCYEPPEIELTPKSAAYNRKAPDAAIKLTAIASRRVNVKVKSADLKFSLKTTHGETGKLSNQVLGADGVVSFDYTFPSFSVAKTDTVVVTCDICADGANTATLDIPMAPTLLGFFNGVWNTRKQAEDGLDKLIKTTDSVKGKQNLAYDLFYNQTGSGKPGGTKVGSALTDVAEVFDQRSQELGGVLSNRWETFWDILNAKHASPKSGLGSMLVLLGNKALALAQLVDTAYSAALGKLVGGFASLLSDPPTAVDLAAHITKLQKYADDGYPVVLVAHSQGNLFVNRAFDSLRASRPAASAKVVHIAPASPTLRGDYALADIDLVINGLRLSGINSVPNVNLTLPTSKQDASGHTLVGTYLDATRQGLDAIKRMIRAAVDPV